MSKHDIVPCAGCTLCCQNELIFLHAQHGDVVTDYLHKVAPNPLTGEMGFALQNKPNGDCIYLGETGCTIYDRAPAVCRKFDCRKLIKNLGDRAAQRRAVRSGFISKELMQAGKDRMHTLEEE